MANKKRNVTQVWRNGNGLCRADVTDEWRGTYEVAVGHLTHWEMGDAMTLLGLDPKGLTKNQRMREIVNHLAALSAPSGPSGNGGDPSGAGDPGNQGNMGGDPAGVGGPGSDPGGSGGEPDPSGAGDPSSGGDPGPDPFPDPSGSDPTADPNGAGGGDPSGGDNDPDPEPEPDPDEYATVAYVDQEVGEIAVVAHGALEEIRQQIADVAASAPKVITVNIPTLPEPVTIQGAHRDLPKLVARLHAGMYVMLIGPAGTGKSYMAHDAAKALGVPCYDLSVTVQTQEWKVAGAHSAVTFIRGTIREAYENGGVLLIDEFDNGSPNFLAGLNLLLSSDTYTFADGETVQRHPQFYVVGTANTIGEGGTAQYRARQALDAATLDRFTFMFVDIDPAIEEMLAAQYLDDLTVRADLLRLVRVSRQNGTDNNLRVVITPRATLDGAKMLALGEPMENVIRDRIIRGCSPDIAEKILEGTGYSPV
jgi:hypothetical protein